MDDWRLVDEAIRRDNAAALLELVTELMARVRDRLSPEHSADLDPHEIHELEQVLAQLAEGYDAMWGETHGIGQRLS
jgi:hypothetical protein